MRVVFDTNVLVAAARSRQGASFALVSSFLSDADDDMVLELAFAAGCRYIITHNVTEFRGSERLGVTGISPRDFLALIRKKP